jgi:DNA-binding response OmpR family regulator
MPGTVLLVEDDADQLEVLAMVLAEFTHRECLRARCYDELVALGSAALACELALVDVNLGPGRPSGLDAYRWLREHRFAGRICFLTGHARSYPLVAQVLAMGDAQLLEKPIEVDELCALVDGVER